MQAFTLALNIIMVVLLAATVSYCYILNRRIRVLQDSKSELAQLLKHFDASTSRASESIVALQSASKKIGETIQSRIDKANFLIDDLAFMIERGNKVADELEASIAVNRARQRVVREEEADDLTDDLLDEEELEVATKPSVSKTNGKAKDKTIASLEAVLGRLSKRSADEIIDEKAARSKGAKLRPEPKPDMANAKSRSLAEEELIQMLRSGYKG